MNQPYDEKELLLRIANGDEVAFKELYNNSWNNLYSFSLSWLKNTAQAEDVVQDVFIKVWTNRAQLASIENINSYLFIICRNAVIGLMEKNSVRLRHNASVINEIDPLLPDSALHLKQMRERINQLVENLPEQQRQVFKMSREEGLSHEEIANRLGIMKETVKNHMVRALNTLRSKIRSINIWNLIWLWIFLSLSLLKVFFSF